MGTFAVLVDGISGIKPNMVGNYSIIITYFLRSFKSFMRENKANKYFKTIFVITIIINTDIQYVCLKTTG